jgi:hypothetical protein
MPAATRERLAGDLERTARQKDKMIQMPEVSEERVVWKETFYSETFDFRGQIIFRRYDECIFVNCTLLMDPGTEQIVFTGCTFKDCNIDSIDTDETRGVVSSGNTFDRPLDEQRKDFEARLAAVLSKRTAKSS